MSHSGDVVCSRKKEAVVFPMVSRGQVVANTCHHNADIDECSSIDGLLHVAPNTHMDLKDNHTVNTEKISKR